MERVLLNEELLSELRSIRRSKDYSQEYMAAAMNISQNSYSRLESGQTEMTISRLLKISEILDIELCYFPPGGGGASSLVSRSRRGNTQQTNLSDFKRYRQ